MKLIDTHAHIYAAAFDEDRAQVMSRAESYGVGKIYLPAIDSGTHAAMLQLENEYPDSCFAMMGLHPCSVKANYAEELQIAREFLEKREFCGIGETGLDFYWDLTYKDEQYLAFRQQVAWALEFDIPVIIHSRNSTDECIAVIREMQKGELKGIFHCFSGNAGQARQITALGFYLGIGGVLTFKNSGLDTVLREIGLEHIVLETDAPYLAPVPFRGKRNEPGYLRYIVEKISQVCNLPMDEVALLTSGNAEKLFGS